ncbi:hypothetical protein LOTGIDRAFT_233068 [Lottia gigantea]|uniref:MHD domain-containing protein n=1 Tax=Lottia gigantea TaxID=225164 RepID=V4AGT7_LOTGI|nr:hypothetical protein LOTGIDRAFT_233068 [Lottia gigantea]ESO92621.1 hypothetical protein LOTGIDRAFT_233068 [Lottia gigantea]
MTTFADHFWGEKNNGFYVLYHNLKNGQTSSKDLIEFLRDGCQVEEQYSKLLTKLAKSAANCAQVGTFAPFWNLLKSLVEKLASLHMQLVHTWSDLIKDIIRYNEDQHKRQKTMKEGEAGTSETVQAIQQTTVAVHKAKELYHTRCLELERLKRDNATQKDLDKAETKKKKTCDEYRGLVEKYNNIRVEYEKKMTDSCHHFQEAEEEHVCQMKDFIDTYTKSWENQHVLIGQVHTEFKRTCDDLTVQRLFETFIQNKTTGKEKPGPLSFVEPDLSSINTLRPMSPEPAEKRDSLTEKQRQELVLFTDSSGSASPVMSDQPGPLSRSVKLRVSRTWFLKKNRKEKTKKKKKKDKDDKDNESLENDTTDNTAPEVDEEGYNIRPEETNDHGEDSKKKIKVQIRPLSPNGATPTGTVEDIKASVEGLRLSPTAIRRRSQTPIDKKMKRSQSESDTLDSLKPSQDLLNLDFFTSSSASTPTGSGYNLPSPLSPLTDSNFISPTQSSITSPTLPSNLSNLFNQSINDINNGGPPPVPGRSTPGPLTSPISNNSFNTSFPSTVIARPPSRNKGLISQNSKPILNSTLPMTRSESSGSVTFNTTSTPVGSSRGPSPLTLGMSDTIPIAIALTETINAFFKGHDAAKCTVKTVGTVMLSFPAGIVRAFTENPSPAMLTFRLKNTSRLENIIVNSQLLVKDETHTENNGLQYQFDMAALTEHIKQQGEKNKTASYFNIDILKYQVKNLPGVESTPIPLVVYWKCNENNTDFRLDYRYNPSSMSSPATLKNISVIAGIEGNVSKMQSIPNGVWNGETHRATWKLNDISDVSEQASQGCIRAKFDMKSGACKPSTTALQFMCEGATLSGTEFELIGNGYRLSLTKKRFASGKYFVDPEQNVKSKVLDHLNLFNNYIFIETFIKLFKEGLSTHIGNLLVAASNYSNHE